MMQKEIHEFIDFLCKAKKATYAGKGNEVTSSRLKSHDLRYVEGNKMYYDSYLGEKEFAGEEAVWVDNAPIWTMNYIGRTLDDAFSGDFLKEALSNVPMDMPYRGPAEFINGYYRYECKVEGQLDWFQGHEEIYYKDKLTYECRFHGGKVQTIR